MNFSEDLNQVLDEVLDDQHMVNATISEHRYDLYAFISLIASILGVCGDIVIFAILMMNTRMSSRRNTILLNWAVFDALDFPPLLELLDYIISFIIPMDAQTLLAFDVCFLSLSTALFKFNCIFLMLLLVSTTVMRMQWITNRHFAIALYTTTAVIYVCNFCVCYFAGYGWIFIKFVLIYLLLLIVVLAKEAYTIYRCCRDDPVGQKTRVKMNVVRIFTYNYLYVTLSAFIALESDIMPLVVIVEMSVHFTSIYILIYLYFADENFSAALTKMFGFCCCTRQAVERSGGDATVVYSDTSGENQASINFNRLQPSSDT